VTPLYPQKLALTSPTGGGRSVGIVRSRTKATEIFCSSWDAEKKNASCSETQRFCTWLWTAQYRSLSWAAH